MPSAWEVFRTAYPLSAVPTLGVRRRHAPRAKRLRARVAAGKRTEACCYEPVDDAIAVDTVKQLKAKLAEAERRLGEAESEVKLSRTTSAAASSRGGALHVTMVFEQVELQRRHDEVGQSTLFANMP